jgi:hypothetical protein
MAVAEKLKAALLAVRFAPGVAAPIADEARTASLALLAGRQRRAMCSRALDMLKEAR